MVLVSKFASVAEPDCASLRFDGENYLLFTWRSAARGSIEAALYVVGENGNRSLVSDWTVRDDDGGSRQVDCPRVVYGSQRFVIFWLEYTGNEGSVTAAELHRSVLDMNSISTGPVYDASITAGIGLLYDVCNDDGGDTTDIFLALSLSTTEIQTVRYDSPYTTTDIVFDVTHTPTHVYRVLGCSVHATDDNMCVHYQAGGDDALELWTFRCDAADGGNYAAAQTMFGHVNSEYARVGSVRTAANEVFVVAEYISYNDETGITTPNPPFSATSPNTRVRSIVSHRIDATDASYYLTEVCQVNHNLTLMSRPWAYRNGFITGNEAYFAVGFSSLEESQEQDQSFMYVVHADLRSRNGAAGFYEVPLVPVAAMTDGSADSRPAQWSPYNNVASIGDTANEDNGGNFGKRMNHMSHAANQPSWDLGPLLKSRTFAYISIERLIAAPVTGGIYGTGILPAQHGVRGFVFNHEDPWLTRRDGSEPNAPSGENIRVTAPWSMGQHAGVQGLTLFNGGVMQTYEGRTLVEHGFLWAPEIWAVAQGTSGALVQTGTYYYVANYAWVDGAGQLHRGPPSTPFVVTLSGVNDDVSLFVRTMTLSMRDNPQHYPRSSPVYVEVWRTTISTGTEIDTDATTGAYTLRRLHGSGLLNSATAYNLWETPANDRTDWYITITDNLADSSLVEHEIYPFQLDTTTLQWSPPPPIPSFGAEVVAKWQNRVWATPPNERVIRYSDEILPLGTQTLAPEFLDTNTYRIDDIGRVTAMQAMDDHLIVFTESGVYALRGLPNDGTGTGSSLTLQVLAQGTGCIEPRSVVLGPPGVFFQSAKGYYLLNRELQLDYITAGAAVEEVIRDAGNVRAATLLEDRHQIRLTIDRAPVANVVQPTVLIYDYLHRQWSEIPLPNFAATSSTLNHCQSATAWRGRMGEVCHVVLAEGGLALERPQDSAVFSDEGASSTVAIPIDVQTEWIHLSGISGLKRVWEVHVQTQRLNAGAMAADVYYDVDGSFDESAPTDTLTWASPAPDVLRIRPSIQKCSSIMIRVYEPSPAATENVRLVSMTLRLGIKKTLRKLPASQIGT